MCKWMMRVSAKYPLPVLIIGFICVFTLAVKWLHSEYVQRSHNGTAYVNGQPGNVEKLLNLDCKLIDEVTVVNE